MSNPVSEQYKDMFDPGWREREQKQHDTFRAIFTLQPVKNTFAPQPAEVDDLEEETKQREHDEWVELGRDS